MVKWGYSPTRSDNIIGPVHRMKWCGGDTFPPVTTTNSDLQSTLPVTSSVSLCLPTSELRNFLTFGGGL
ncbi:hypothetical protein V1477_014648 [Vespula maculifrons]|uniref:Uncharacterized protein n=1 Tax=Vespula maculifrons TaxID=7453 RepID=A0ABD2BI18_VESMC